VAVIYLFDSGWQFYACIVMWDYIGLGCLTPLSTIFQLYCESVLLVEKKTEKTTDMPQVTDKLYHIMLYWVPLAWTGFELTTLVVIGTDCIGSCKSNYHTITTTTTRVITHYPYKWSLIRYHLSITRKVVNLYVFHVNIHLTYYLVRDKKKRCSVRNHKYQRPIITRPLKDKHCR